MSDDAALFQAWRQGDRAADQALIVHHERALEQLMLELYCGEEMAIDELATELEVPTGTVKSRLHRARGLLAELIPRIAATPEEVESARVVLRGWSESGDGGAAGAAGAGGAGSARDDG